MDVELTLGSHNVLWSAPERADLIASITVAEAGVTCDSVTGGACYTAAPVTAPGVLITAGSPFLVTGHLAEAAADICNYVSDAGGRSSVSFSHFLAIMYKHMGLDALIPSGYEPGFTVDFNDFLTAMYCHMGLAALVPSAIKTKCGW